MQVQQRVDLVSCLARNIIPLRKCAFANLSDRLYRVCIENPGNYCLKTRPFQGLDVQVMSWQDATKVPNSGNKLIIIGTDSQSQLHIRIFKSDGKHINRDETQLPSGEAEAISTLKQYLSGLKSPDKLSDEEKAHITTEVESILGRSPYILGY